MKRVLICSTNYLPHIGGAEIAIHEITQRINRQEFSFDVLTARLDRKLPRQETMGAVRVYRVGFGFWGDKFLLPLFGMVRYISLRTKPYHIIWSMMASQGSVLATGISVLAGIPLLLTLQEGDEEKHLMRYVGGSHLLYALFIRPWYRLVFWRAHRMTAISNHLAERARLHSSAPIDIVPNGVDIETFAHFDEERADSIKKTYALNGKHVIVTVSRLVHKNNVSILIKSLTHLPKNVILLIVGSGDEEETLRLLVEERAVQDRVVFVGRVEPGLIPGYMQVADVFARVPLSEGLGNVFLEAFAAGIPVVASPVGGIVDIVAHQQSGLLVSPHDEQAVARAIDMFLEDKQLREQCVQAGREVVARYTWTHIAHHMSRVLADM